MSFIWPWVLVSLLAIPICVFVYLRLQQKRSRDAASLGTLGIVTEDAARHGGPGWRRHVPPAILLVGVALLAIASARPEIEIPLPRMEGTVLLAFDVSASMAADDVEPTRMDVAKQVGRTLVEQRPGSAKIGVVAFGEGGLVVQPPTDDNDALIATIDRLVPQSGTSLGPGILTALSMVYPESYLSSDGTAPLAGSAPQAARAPSIIVLLTDGENTDPPDPLEAAQLAIDHGVRVYTVGLGTSAGAVVEIDGFNLSTSLNEPVLQEVALLTEGEYFRIEAMDDAPPVYEELETEFVVESREIEITSILGAVSMIASAGRRRPVTPVVWPGAVGGDDGTALAGLPAASDRDTAGCARVLPGAQAKKAVCRPLLQPVAAETGHARRHTLEATPALRPDRARPRCCSWWRCPDPSPT